MTKKPMALIILDGYGINEATEGNAIRAAKTPNMDKYLAENPNTMIYASGMNVGLPDGQMGNSEVGHTNIGAGRVVYQELTRISKAISDGDFFENEVLAKAVENCKNNNKAMHFIGLLSNGGVHSHIEHLFGLVDLAKRRGLEKVYIHCIMDGRDVSPTSGVDFIAELQEKLAQTGVGKIATVMGRYYAMDRDNNWNRVEKAYNAMVKGIGAFAENPIEMMKKSYETKDENGSLITDEFIIPAVITENGQPIAKIEAGDSVVCFNFRPDRAREITRTLVDDKFTGFERVFMPLHFVCMTQYDASMPNVEVAFKPQSLVNTFGEYISKKGLKQLRIAETEKYAHVTFFFNGGVEAVYDGEDRKLIPSPKVATYDMQPEMSAYLVADACVELINQDKYDCIVLNFANCDMVGHTGVFEAAVKAVEAVDECVGRVVSALSAKDAHIIITADHGNADCMIDPDTGEAFTAHTTNPVPLILLGAGNVKLKKGKLADIAPTMLDLMNLPKPSEMTGESLIVRE
ncbi:MAG: 2,3-bisphosphoglycerate-independent phosphoglycerate mutase [Clostridia bacterium]|nr:2,3-bisphosphoglycerate-independent phosphoglycerate mutase [Clostridia bacterium]